VNNPFNFNDPTPPDKFLGRWDTANRIAEDLCAAQSNSHAIIAGRRCGKTSLLHALQDRLLRRLATTERGEWHVLPVLLDVLSLKNESPFCFYKGFIRELGFLTTRDEFVFGNGPVLPLDLDIALIERYYSKDAPASGLDEFKRAAGHAVSRAKDRYGPLRLVFLVDEVEEISELEWANELFGNLRSLTTDPRTSPHIRLVMAGSQRFLRAQRRPGSPLLNMFKQHHLEAFSDDVMYELVALGGELSDVIAREVIELSGGHPYIAQFLMHHLWERQETATVDDVKAIGSRLRAQYAHILNGWHQAIGHSGQQVFGVVANTNKEWVTPEAIRKAITDSGVETDEGLAALVFHNFIIKSDKLCQYRCGSELFRQWFLAKQGEGRKAMSELSPEVRAKALSFLIDIGRWAASELKERWKIARQKKGAEQPTEVDLSEPEEEVTRDAEAILQDITAERGVAEVERVVKLIERKRDLIYEWRESKLDNEQETNRGLLPRSALRLRQQELDHKIAETMAEIEADLQGLGVKVDKEEVEQRANRESSCS